MFLGIHYTAYIKALGPMNNYWTFPFENHHQKIKKDVDIHSKNVSFTSFRLNYLFVETVYNDFACRICIKKYKAYESYKELLIDKKIISINNYAIEMIENKIVGLILKIFRLKRNNLILLDILPCKIVLEDLSYFYQIEKKFARSFLVDIKKIKFGIYFKLEITGDKTYLVLKMKNQNL
jgi:hypothetical protein